MIDKDRLQNERELIYQLLHDKDAIDKFYDFGLTKEHFSEENHNIVAFLLKAYNCDNVLLTRKSFKEQLKKYKVPKERIAQELAFNSCYSTKSSPDDFPFLANKIIENNVKTLTGEAIVHFKKNKSLEGYIPAIKKLVDDFSEILDGSVVSKEKSYYDDIRVLSKERIQYIEDVRAGKIKEEPLILSGIREMDYTMVNGFEKGTLTLICADVGHFKSAMMLNIGLNVWKGGNNVLFVPLEMTKEQMWRRACSRESRVRSELITRNIKDLTDEQMEKIKKMDSAWDSYPSKFFIMEDPGNTTVLKIQQRIEKNIEIFKPRLVVIDYVANLESHKERYGRNDLEIGDMLKFMRQIGKDKGFAVLSAAQLGRTALTRIRKTGANRDKASINSEDIRGSHEYSADADNIFAQLKSTSQPNELLDIFCVKSRHGPTSFENGNTRATLEILPEFGLITSSHYGEELGENEVEGNAYSYDEDLGDMIDKSETDVVLNNNEMFSEPDTMYNHHFYDKDDNEDIAAAINDGEETKSTWDDNF